MAPFSKKRKEPSNGQSRTLVDFFSNNAPTKKSKLRSSRPKPDKNSVDFNTPSTREIIIIDSDSDDCSPKGDKGRSPEIPNAGRTLYCAKQCEWKPSFTHVAPSSKHEVLRDDGPLTFGRPSTLLQAPFQSNANAVAGKKASSGIETTSTASIFGVPTSLLRSSVDPAHDPSHATYDHEKTFTGDAYTLDYTDVPTPNEHLGGIPHSTDVIDIDFNYDDGLWSAGDDELAVLDSVDDNIEIDDVSEQLNEYRTPSHSASCPVCECDLSRLRGLVSDMTAAGDTSNPCLRSEKTMSINVSIPLSVPHTFPIV
ncbi:hypothetical protein K503DRAFT_524794 [Rhizopogon vinicolor AM-OR11-026]|uniref:Uncharacterized protein n=1 Tax=Rhizopogon vinicolor AM-OR11-026 TaxID=1314800 RepID=A0A1B7N8R8_9AGAM|nr:hypothetical protein K503DRAFT_524794 [Rhizopogon vinicolor AM-OR11-026]